MPRGGKCRDPKTRLTQTGHGRLGWVLLPPTAFPPPAEEAQRRGGRCRYPLALLTQTGHSRVGMGPAASHYLPPPRTEY